MREQEPRVVLTIGHSTRTWEAFLKLLRAHLVNGPRRLVTCIWESSGACIIHDVIRRAWAGAMLHVPACVSVLLACRWELA